MQRERKRINFGRRGSTCGYVATRGICPDCAKRLGAAGVKAGSVLKE